MHCFVKKIVPITFLLLLLALPYSCKRSKGPYNPYLKMKTKPTEQMRKADKKIVKKGNKTYERQLGKNRKKLFGRKKPPKA